MSEKRVKLTMPQLNLLAEVASGIDRCVKAYAPAQKLAKDGLVRWFDDDDYSGRLKLTDAALPYLDQH